MRKPLKDLLTLFTTGKSTHSETKHNFGQPFHERPDFKVLHYSERHPEGVHLGFGEFFLDEDRPDLNLQKGDIHTDINERARLRREQREAFDSMPCFHIPSKLEQQNRGIPVEDDDSKPFWMESK
jgi:hypothetical protein